MVGAVCQCESPADSCELLCTCLFFMMNRALHACIHTTPPYKSLWVSMRNPVWLLLCMPVLHDEPETCTSLLTNKRTVEFLQVMLLASQILNPWPQTGKKQSSSPVQTGFNQDYLSLNLATIFFPSTLDQPRTCNKNHVNVDQPRTCNTTMLI